MTNVLPARARMFEPIARAPRLSDRVADQLLASILARGLKPGDRLPSERELGEQFGVSRTVIREATRALVAKGVIDVRAGTGLTVVAVAPSSVADSMNLYLRGEDIPYEKVHEVRAMIEVQVAGLAADRGTPEELERLRKLHERFRELEPCEDIEASSVVDVDFHRQLARMTQNELHLVMLDSIGEVLLDVRRATVAIPAEAALAVRAHSLILDRVSAHDADGARGAMRQHLDEAFQAWVRMGRSVRTALPSPAP